MYNKKLSDGKIAKKLSVNHSSVARRKLYLGLPSNHEWKGKRNQKFTFTEKFKVGKKLIEIASRRYGLNVYSL